MICNLMLGTPRCSLRRQLVLHLDLQTPINLCQRGEDKDVEVQGRGEDIGSHTQTH